MEAIDYFNKDYFRLELQRAGVIKNNYGNDAHSLTLEKVPSITIGLVLAAKSLKEFENHIILNWIRKGKEVTSLIEDQFALYDKLSIYLQNNVYTEDDIEKWKQILNATKYVFPENESSGWAQIFGDTPILLDSDDSCEGNDHLDNFFNAKGAKLTAGSEIQSEKERNNKNLEMTMESHINGKETNKSKDNIPHFSKHGNFLSDDDIYDIDNALDYECSIDSDTEMQEMREDDVLDLAVKESELFDPQESEFGAPENKFCISFPKSGDIRITKDGSEPMIATKDETGSDYRKMIRLYHRNHASRKKKTWNITDEEIGSKWWKKILEVKGFEGELQEREFKEIWNARSYSRGLRKWDATRVLEELLREERWKEVFCDVFEEVERTREILGDVRLGNLPDISVREGEKVVEEKELVETVTHLINAKESHESELCALENKFCISLPKSGDIRIRKDGSETMIATKDETESDYRKELNKKPWEDNMLDQQHSEALTKPMQEGVCICGISGEWYNRMLECQRCKRWFHEACIGCLCYKLICGDRFYLYVCECCNNGREFLHKIPIDWKNLLHLALWNLSSSKYNFGKFGKYFNYKEITIWVNTHWKLLQCPPYLQKIPITNRAQYILLELKANQNLFKKRFWRGKKVGTEIINYWTLKVPVPPSVPEMILSSEIPIIEALLPEISCFERTTQLPFIPKTFKVDDVEPVTRIHMNPQDTDDNLHLHLKEYFDIDILVEKNMICGSSHILLCTLCSISCAVDNMIYHLAGKKHKCNLQKAKAVSEKPCKLRKTKKVKDETRPKRPISGYILYLIEIWEQIKMYNPGISVKDISKKAEELWNALGDKSKWLKLEEAAQEDYDYALEEWKAGGRGQGGGGDNDGDDAPKKASIVENTVSKKSGPVVVDCITLSDSEDDGPPCAAKRPNNGQGPMSSASIYAANTPAPTRATDEGDNTHGSDGSEKSSSDSDEERKIKRSKFPRKHFISITDSSDSPGQVVESDSDDVSENSGNDSDDVERKRKRSRFESDCFVSSSKEMLDWLNDSENSGNDSDDEKRKSKKSKFEIEHFILSSKDSSNSSSNPDSYYSPGQEERKIKRSKFVRKRFISSTNSSDSSGQDIESDSDDGNEKSSNDSYDEKRKRKRSRFENDCFVSSSKEMLDWLNVSENSGNDFDDEERKSKRSKFVIDRFIFSSKDSSNSPIKDDKSNSDGVDKRSRRGDSRSHSPVHGVRRDESAFRQNQHPALPPQQALASSSWKEEKRDNEFKWTSLSHKGPVFADPYVRVPKHVKLLYNGEHMVLSDTAEEVAGFYAKMLELDYKTKELFNNNFFKDWRKQMTEEEREKITKLSNCDFRQMYTYYSDQKEHRKNRSKEEKRALKDKNQELIHEYGWCIIDGHKQRIRNFKIEPPGLFRGCGEHPKQGMLKKRIEAEDVSINCSKDSEIPEPPSGHKWKNVCHGNQASWLACWVENVQGKTKYILNPASKIQGYKDLRRYETASKLHQIADRIRENYRADFKSREMRIRQRSVAMYFIDKLALRAGNEKYEDQAYTVGCCSLRVEHIELHKEKDGKECVVVFDFLGKNPFRYYNEIPVEKEVFKNLQLFVENKNEGDDLFDRLNTASLNKHLNKLMEGLTAKVFHTYNASRTLQEQLYILTDPKDSIPAKVQSYKRAIREVYIQCNHQCAVPKTFDKRMENLQENIEDKKIQVKDADRQLEDAKKAAKSGSSGAKVVNQKNQKGLDRILDPRISVTWAKKFDVPLEKVYNKTQHSKFQWVIDLETADYNFFTEPMANPVKVNPVAGTRDAEAGESTDALPEGAVSEAGEGKADTTAPAEAVYKAGVWKVNTTATAEAGKVTATAPAEVLLAPNSVFRHCEICKVDFINETVHLTSRSHKRSAAKKMIVEKKIKKMKGEDCLLWHQSGDVKCVWCNEMLYNAALHPNSINLHLNGNRHRKNKPIKEEDCLQQSPSGEIKCLWCNVTVDTPELLQHLITLKHRDNAPIDNSTAVNPGAGKREAGKGTDALPEGAILEAGGGKADTTAPAEAVYKAGGGKVTATAPAGVLLAPNSVYKYCEICKVDFINEIKHLVSISHIREAAEKMIVEMKMKGEDCLLWHKTGYVMCVWCKAVLKLSKINMHLNGKRHKKNKLIKEEDFLQQSPSGEIRCLWCNVMVNTTEMQQHLITLKHRDNAPINNSTAVNPGAGIREARKGTDALPEEAISEAGGGKVDNTGSAEAVYKAGGGKLNTTAQAEAEYKAEAGKLNATAPAGVLLAPNIVCQNETIDLASPYHTMETTNETQVETIMKEEDCLLQHPSGDIKCLWCNIELGHPINLKFHLDGNGHRYRAATIAGVVKKLIKEGCLQQCPSGEIMCLWCNVTIHNQELPQHLATLSHRENASSNNSAAGADRRSPRGKSRSRSPVHGMRRWIRDESSSRQDQLPSLPPPPSLQHQLFSQPPPPLTHQLPSLPPPPLPLQHQLFSSPPPPQLPPPVLQHQLPLLSPPSQALASSRIAESSFREITQSQMNVIPALPNNESLLCEVAKKVAKHTLNKDTAYIIAQITTELENSGIPPTLEIIGKLSLEISEHHKMEALLCEVAKKVAKVSLNENTAYIIAQLTRELENFGIPPTLEIIGKIVLEVSDHHKMKAIKGNISDDYGHGSSSNPINEPSVGVDCGRPTRNQSSGMPSQTSVGLVYQSIAINNPGNTLLQRSGSAEPNVSGMLSRQAVGHMYQSSGNTQPGNTWVQNSGSVEPKSSGMLYQQSTEQRYQSSGNNHLNNTSFQSLGNMGNNMLGQNEGNVMMHHNELNQGRTQGRPVPGRQGQSQDQMGPSYGWPRMR